MALLNLTLHQSNVTSTLHVTAAVGVCYERLLKISVVGSSGYSNRVTNDMNGCLGSSIMRARCLFLSLLDL
jgi:hypothetical protein